MGKEKHDFDQIFYFSKKSHTQLLIVLSHIDTSFYGTTNYSFCCMDFNKHLETRDWNMENINGVFVV